MSFQDSNRCGDSICKVCVLYYDCLLDDKKECQDWQDVNRKVDSLEEEV